MFHGQVELPSQTLNAAGSTSGEPELPGHRHCDGHVRNLNFELDLQLELELPSLSLKVIFHCGEPGPGPGLRSAGLLKILNFNNKLVEVAKLEKVHVVQAPGPATT